MEFINNSIIQTERKVRIVQLSKITSKKLSFIEWKFIRNGHQSCPVQVRSNYTENTLMTPKSESTKTQKQQQLKYRPSPSHLVLKYTFGMFEGKDFIHICIYKHVSSMFVCNVHETPLFFNYYYSLFTVLPFNSGFPYFTQI